MNEPGTTAVNIARIPMSYTRIARAYRSARALGLRFARCASGIAAVEFALILPIMALLLFGGFELSRAISIDRRFGMVTSMTGDLVAREEKLGDDPTPNFQGIMDAMTHIMQPYDTSTLELTVLSVRASDASAEEGHIAYSCTRTAGSPDGSCSLARKCEAITLPKDITHAGGSVVIVESKYTYEPVLANFFTGPLAWSDKATFSPRNSCADAYNQKCLLSCS